MSVSVFLKTFDNFDKPSSIIFSFDSAHARTNIGMQTVANIIFTGYYSSFLQGIRKKTTYETRTLRTLYNYYYLLLVISIVMNRECARSIILCLLCYHYESSADHESVKGGQPYRPRTANQLLTLKLLAATSTDL